MAEILTPRPAATVLTLRDAGEGYEILMLRRNIRSDFVGGAYVFPGGGVDDVDKNADALVLGRSSDEASARLELDEGGLAYYVAALRELFEEAGLLVVCDEAGDVVAIDAAREKRLVDRRAALNAGTLDFATILRDEAWLLDLRAMEYLAHWVTPVGPPRRFDTRFFVVRAPEDQVAMHDNDETVANTWLRPRDALSAHERGEFEMMFPTVRTLEAIAGLESVDEVLDYARTRDLISRVEPQIVERDGTVVILTPGDEGFRS